jgi:hypothetical protein
MSHNDLYLVARTNLAESKWDEWDEFRCAAVLAASPEAAVQAVREGLRASQVAELLPGECVFGELPPEMDLQATMIDLSGTGIVVGSYLAG